MLGLLAGAGVGLGLCLLVAGWRPPRPDLAEILASVDQATVPGPSGPPPATGGGWVAAAGAVPARWLARRGWVGPAARPADLTVSGTSPDRLAAERVVAAAAGALTPALLGVMLAAAGIGVPAVVWAIGVLGLAVAGYLTPGVVVARQAGRIREQMRYGLSAFLDLTVVSLAAGCGVEQALTHAAATGDGPIFIQLRHAIATAEATRVNLWTALADLGGQTGLPELRELAASLALAGTEGARVRGSLAAKAATLRLRLLADAEAAALTATERMSLPVVALFAGFLVFVGYPSVTAVLNL